MSIVRTPMFFGPASRSLFGWFHAPAGDGTDDSAGDLGVVICPPLGHEYINAHRSVRHLADRLARAGLPSIRFDYHGVGDSTGNDEDPDRLNMWSASVRDAIEALRELSGCTRIALVGVRLGAALAVSVARETDLAALVLWTPCVKGRAYARELKALHLTGGNHEVAIDGGRIEPGGFVVTDETQRAISCINLEDDLPRSERVLIVARHDLAGDTRLHDVWSRAGVHVEQRAMPGYSEMFLPPHNSVVPDLAISAIVEWLAALNHPGGRARMATSSPIRTEQQLTHDGAEIRESLVRIDREHELFGILSEPLHGAAPDTPMIVLTNAGATHHVGPNRLYVFLARTLARAGFRTLRFDLPGLGDSVIDDAAQENDPYVPIASNVIAAALDAMHEREPGTRFVLMGLCSGAHAAFHAALSLPDAPIVESVLINPLTFYYKPGMPLDETPTNHAEEWQRYTRSVRSLDHWAKLLRGDVRLTAVATTVMHRLRTVAGESIAAIREALGGEAAEEVPSDDLGRDVRSIVTRGRKLTFVFSRHDPGYELLMNGARRVVKQFSADGTIKLWRIDYANHTFEAKHSRDVMIESVARHLRQRYISV
jgi:alpha-beta hydrolase superfamily lysophospholipase